MTIEDNTLQEQLDVANTLIVQLQADLAAEKAKSAELERQLRANPMIQKRMLEDLKELDKLIEEKEAHRDNIPRELEEDERDAIKAVRQKKIDGLRESRKTKAEYIKSK